MGWVRDDEGELDHDVDLADADRGARPLGRLGVCAADAYAAMGVRAAGPSRSPDFSDDEEVSAQRPIDDYALPAAGFGGGE